MRKTVMLRKLLEKEKFIVCPGAHDAISARLIEEAGFKMFSISGYGASISMGLIPEVGFVTMSEMATFAKYIAEATDIPAIVDADTGYGPPVIVTRTVKEFEKAGLAGVHIEDQLDFKKVGRHGDDFQTSFQLGKKSFLRVRWWPKSKLPFQLGKTKIF